MTLIERAAKRLEELRRAGVELPAEKFVSADAEAVSRNLPPNDWRPSQFSTTGPATSSTTHAESAPTRDHDHSFSNRFDLDLGRLASMGFVTPNVQRSRVADEFRVLKRPLLANASAKQNSTVRHKNLIMVTSAVPGEGKTFTALNLAMSIALELDKTVLLVDADVARPSLPRLLDIAPTKGLLDVLTGDVKELSGVLFRTNVEKLSILPSGTPTSHATELLASDSMSSLLADVAGRYADRIVIFDSPPLLATTEARVLATQMGQIVFVVHAESTMQSDVKNALATIDSCPLKLMVLNQAVSTGQGAHGYGYGYGYGN